MGPESNNTALEIREQSAEVRDKLPFLAQKVTARDDIENTIRDLDGRIKAQETDIWRTGENISERNDNLDQNQKELTGTVEKISTIDNQIGKNTQEIGTNDSQVKSIDAKIKALQDDSSGGGETPETVEAVNGPSNQTTGSKESESRGNKEQEIAALTAQKQALQARNAELQKQNEALKAEKVPLVARRDELQNTTIPGTRAEIEQLTLQKQEQEAEKNSLIEEREGNSAEVAVLDSEIEAEQKIISRINESISRSQALYRENIERERPEKQSLFTQMSSDFVGVLA